MDNELCLIYDVTTGTASERPIVRQISGSGYSIQASGSAGQSQSGSPPGLFTETGQSFLSTVQPGDRLRIANVQTDSGLYKIVSVDSDTQITTDGQFDGATGLSWQIERAKTAVSSSDLDGLVRQTEQDDGVGYGDYAGIAWGDASQMLGDPNLFCIDESGSPPAILKKKPGAPQDPNDVP